MTNLNVRERDPQEENLGSFYMGRMRPSPQPRRILPRGALTAVILFSFAALIWYAYPRGQEKYSDIDIPTINADKTAFKFKPDNPGGMEVRHQDSTVFNPLENKPVDKVEHLRPKPEQPMNKAEAVKAAAAPIDKTPHTLDLKPVSKGTEKLVGGAEAKAAPPAKAIPAKAIPAKAIPAKSIPAKAAPVMKQEESKSALDIALEEVDATKAESAKIEKAPAATVKPAPEKTAKQPKVAAATSSSVYIQLGAYRDLAGAKQDWARLQKKFPETLGRMSLHTESVTTAKGVLTRLQAGKVSQSRAKQLCTTLKAGGQAGCIIVQ